MVTAAASHLETVAPIYVMDREAGAYLLASLIADQRDFVVRVAPRRFAQEHAEAAKEVLRTVVGRTPVRLQRTVNLARRTGTGKPRETRRDHPPRDGRPATLTIRACAVVLPRPRKVDASLPASLTVHVVLVREEQPPAGVVPIEWLLVTTLPIGETTAVAAVIDHYRARWTIEEFFKALKSGCRMRTASWKVGRRC